MASSASMLRSALIVLASVLATPAALAHAHLTKQSPAAKASRSEQDKTQLIVPLDQTLEAGKYTVDWHVVSVDGHKTKGQYTFSVK